MSVAAESIQIENVVASSDIGQELDIETVADDLGGSEYNPDQFPGVIYRLQEPNATALIFRSGKIVSTGADSIDNVQTALTVVFEDLRELGITVRDAPDIEVQNIVSSADLDQPLNLNAIAIGLGLEHIEYEPEQFPGLVYRLDDLAVVALLFGSGKVVITGGKHLEDADQALAVIETRLTDLGLME